jgi:hypothetical protein
MQSLVRMGRRMDQPICTQRQRCGDTSGSWFPLPSQGRGQGLGSSMRIYDAGQM